MKCGARDTLRRAPPGGASLKLMTDAAAYTRLGSDQYPKIAVNATGDAVVVWYQQTDAPFALGIWTRVYR